jgi:hypothetical protein
VDPPDLATVKDFFHFYIATSRGKVVKEPIANSVNAFADRNRQRNLLAVSTASNGTDDGEGGFVFHQLGTVERFAGDRSQTTSVDKLGRGAWLPTGFCVVVRFGSTGQSQSTYIIYDMFPENVEGDRVHIESGDTWGRLVPDAPLPILLREDWRNFAGASTWVYWL